MSEPLSAEEEAKFRESVRLISEDAEGDGWSWWSNTTAARLLATLDAERAASERPPVDPLRAHLDFCGGGEFCSLDDCLCECHVAALASPAAPRPEGPLDAEDYDIGDNGAVIPRAAVPPEGLTGRDVHREWRDGMLAQGREVAPERMAWDTLDQRDRDLDDRIAARLAAAPRPEGLDVERLRWMIEQLPVVPGDYTEVVGQDGRGPFISKPAVLARLSDTGEGEK